MIRRPPRSTLSSSSAASDVYKRQMPPSSDDGPGRTPPQGKGRATSKRAKGKQKGAPGTNLSWSDAPNDHKDRFPHGACGCGTDLATATDLGVVDAFQQIEIPTVRAAVSSCRQRW